VEQDYFRQVREIRRELIPYLKDARSWGHKAVIKKDKLMVNGRTYSLKELKEKIKPATRSDSVDNSVGGMRQEEEMIQQDKVYRETSSSFVGSKRGKERSHSTTAETSRFRRDDTRQQRERGGRGQVARSKGKSDI
jgi:hypothetical protein